MRKKQKARTLPETCHLRICGTSDFGDLMAQTLNPEDNPNNYKIYVLENKKIKPPLAEGDCFIAKLHNPKNTWWAKPLARTRTAENNTEVLHGVIEEKDKKFYLKSAEKNSRKEYLLDRLQGAKVGDFVKAELCGEERFKQVKIIKNYGKFNVAKGTDLIVLEKYNIETEFSQEVLKASKHLKPYSKDKREDLTAIPLVTIDGDDSKDFDDAVWAQKIDNGFDIIVAIADVAYYVRPNSPLDREAYKRGNSVYLPNMVVPMLPEILSNDLCSLRPKEERPCIACRMRIDMEGNIKSYSFHRAVMKSCARLTYREVQLAFDGEFNQQTSTLFKPVLQPLYEAYFALKKNTQKRGALELEPTEIKVKVGSQGQILSIGKAEHFMSHEIIEEFMIAANVSAALALQKSKLPIMYRIHDKPSKEKLQDLEPLLHNLHLKLPDYAALKPEHFNHILELCRKQHFSAGINDLILRTQSQAQYSPENIGHFGLALKNYAHFTSPIRRYADLLIHRALISAYEMPDGGGLEEGADIELFKQIGAHISQTERTAAQAERESVARYISAYLNPSIGLDFEVKITGLTQAGIFVCIESLGADGLIPMRSLPMDNYVLDASQTELVGKQSKKTFLLGEKIIARLTEASPLTGSLAFKLVDKDEGVDYAAGYPIIARHKKQDKASSHKTKKERKAKIKRRNRQKEKRKA